MTRIFLVWDFDGAIGQINATKPYNFHYENFAKETDNVRFILKTLNDHNIKCCFAVTGFTGEESVPPFDQRALIREIFENGHEIASHTWRHEWLPLFSKEQIIRSFRRSKLALENCTGVKGSVTGLIVPHNRPMTWIKKGAFSLGDRGLYPFFWGGDLGNIASALHDEGYKWARIVSRTRINSGLIQEDVSNRKWFRDKVIMMQNTYTGFDSTAISKVEQSIKQKKDIMISAHPLALGFGREESKENFVRFIEKMTPLIERRSVSFCLPGTYDAATSNNR